MSVNVSVLAGFALRALRTNKMRSILTMLGIVIGVASVILIISLGEGLQKEVNGIFNMVSMNSIVVWSDNNTKPLTEADAEAIAALPVVKVAVPSAGSSAVLTYQDQKWAMYIEGTTEDQMGISTMSLEDGRFISRSDVLNAAPYVVLGQRPYEKLFPPGTDPIGEEIKIKGRAYKVIGLLKPSGTSNLLEDMDNVLYMPISTVKQRVMGVDNNNIDSMWVQIGSRDDLDLAVEELRTVLETRHHVKDTETSEFSFRTMEEQLSQVTRITSILTLFLSAIAGISLLVGGIGIMNIMLVSVTERTREIGVRMAIGASDRDIMVQFLVEAVFLSLVGCLIGMAIGTGIGQIFGWAVNWEVPVSLKGIALSVGFSSLVGIAFGFYPARRAAHLSPADALGYE